MELVSLGEISKSSGYGLRTIQRWGKYFFPNRYVAGLRTLLTREESEELLAALKLFHSLPSGKEKVVKNFVAAYRKK